MNFTIVAFSAKRSQLLISFEAKTINACFSNNSITVSPIVMFNVKLAGRALRNCVLAERDNALKRLRKIIGNF